MTRYGSAHWVKSSYSDGEGGNCVEWAPIPARMHGVVPVRDSKVPHAPALTFGASAWSTFIGGVKGSGSAAL
ncbi:DUF397 domain-containing protein [Streptomyces sp. NPDC055078]